VITTYGEPNFEKEIHSKGAQGNFVLDSLRHSVHSDISATTRLKPDQRVLRSDFAPKLLC